MKPLLIDFAPRQSWFNAGTDTTRRVLWAGLTLLCLVLLLASLSLAWKLQQERSVVNTRVAALETELEITQESDASNESANAESADAVEKANTHLNYPWATMLGAIERNTLENISLISLEMGVLRQSTKLIVEAPNTSAVLGVLESLREEPGYTSIALTRQEAAAGEGHSQTRFTLDAPVTQAEQASKKGEAR